MLYAPAARPDLLPRPWLTERLSERPACPLTLVSAPRGYGKTTVLVDWLSRAGLPYAWLSLDEADNDPVRFCTYLIAALQRVDAN